MSLTLLKKACMCKFTLNTIIVINFLQLSVLPLLLLPFISQFQLKYHYLVLSLAWVKEFHGVLALTDHNKFSLVITS